MAMMCSALFAARSPPRFRQWRIVLPDEAGIGLTPQSAAKLASDDKRSGLSPAVAAVARRSRVRWVSAPRDRVRVVDDGGDHDVEIGDLVLQLEISPGERLERDPVGGDRVAIVGEIGPPGGQRTDVNRARICRRLFGLSSTR